MYLNTQDILEEIEYQCFKNKEKLNQLSDEQKKLIITMLSNIVKIEEKTLSQFITKE